MQIRVKIDGVSRLYDLDRVRYPSQLSKGDSVMMLHPKLRDLVIGKVFSVVQDCVTIEYQDRGFPPCYKMIYSRKLWDKVLKLNSIEMRRKGRPSKYAGRPEI